MQPILHLSLPVRDLAESKRFYTDVLGCEIGRERESWLDVWFFGMQVTLHQAPDELAADEGAGHRHFGVTLPSAELDEVLARVEGHGVAWSSPPRTDYEGTEREQRKAMILDPSGHAIELKTYRDPDTAFRGAR